MNCLRNLLIINGGNGKRLLPNKTVCYLKETTHLSAELEQLQGQCVKKLLFPLSIQQRENVLNNASCLFPGSRTCLKTVFQSFHTDGSRQWTHRTEDPLALGSEEAVTELSQQVLSSAGQMDVMVRSVPLKQVEQLVLGLHQYGWQAEHIRTLLSSQPSLIHQRRSVLSSVKLLLMLGFDLEQVRTVLQHVPQVVQTPGSQITQVMDALRDLGFEEQKTMKVVTHNPSLLLSAKAVLYQRVKALRQLFKSADVIDLVIRCPRLFTDDWEKVQAKFDYVFHEMNVTQKQMLYASLFNHSLTHIKQRHTFLVSTSLFVMAKRKEGEKSPNATLDQIIASSDKVFCQKFGGFDVAEYRAFCQLAHKQQASLQEPDSESDHENEET